jgi:hypothetical protein
MIALANQAPSLEYYIAYAFIKLFEDLETKSFEFYCKLLSK